MRRTCPLVPGAMLENAVRDFDFVQPEVARVLWRWAAVPDPRFEFFLVV